MLHLLSVGFPSKETRMSLWETKDSAPVGGTWSAAFKVSDIKAVHTDVAGECIPT